MRYQYAPNICLTHLEKEIEQKKKSLVRIYKRELIFAILAAIFVASTFVPVINTYFIVFMVKDINDNDEVRVAKYFLLAYSFADLFAKISNIVFQFYRRRKISFIAAVLVITLAWSMVLIARLTEFYYLASVAGFVAYMGIGALLFPSFNIYLSEICPPAFMGIAYGFYTLVSTV